MIEFFEKYSEKDLYDRCGYDDTKYNAGLIKATNKIFVLSDGTRVPIMKYVEKPNDGLSRGLVLKAKKGFIPVNKITSISDISDYGKYIKDETEWIQPYVKGKYSYYDEEVLNLSIVLGKYWKGQSYSDVLLKTMEKYLPISFKEFYELDIYDQNEIIKYIKIHYNHIKYLQQKIDLLLSNNNKELIKKR